MTIPCKDCLLIPLCRNKHFNTLVTECTLVHEFMAVRIDDTAHLQRYRIEDVEKVLEPNTWNLRRNGLLRDKTVEKK